MTPMFSAYVVTPVPPRSPATIVATPSPMNARPRYGVRFRPVSALTALTCPVFSATRTTATGAMSAMALPLNSGAWNAGVPNQEAAPTGARSTPWTVTPRYCRPFQITGGNEVTRDRDIWNVPKRDLAGAVQVALQSRRLKIAADLPDAQVLVAELQNFRVKISLAGHDSYGAGTGEEWRVGAHDDLVLAVAIALWAAQRSRGATLQAI